MDYWCVSNLDSASLIKYFGIPLIKLIIRNVSIPLGYSYILVARQLLCR